ncbi:MAG: hypothetical protein HRU70_09500 [Phycisphaeraceae bacterium]|nr:MAG: hypothetical protein HRU70_09500 [Phycisphaeraceae bacterium]
MTRWSELPRSTKWAVAAAAGLGVYFLAVEPIVISAASIAERARTKETTLRTWDQVSSSHDSEARAASDGLRDFGEVMIPGDPRERGEALNAKLASVLTSRGVSEYARRERTAPMTGKRSQALERAVEGGGRISRLIRDVDFRCTPDVLAGILSDLERSPEVSSISGLHVRKVQSGGARGSSPQRQISVSLSAECWVLQRRESTP